MSASDVRFKLRLFDSAKQRYQNDVNLSQAGKERALAGVRDEELAYKSDAILFLKVEWDKLSREYDEREQREQELEQAESKSWRYDVLAHEREVVKQELSRARDTAELEQVYARNSSSGVPERRLAVAELSPEYAERLGNVSVRLRAERLLNELHDTPELKEHREAGAALVKKAMELVEITREAHEHYIKLEPGYTFSSPFLALPGELRLNSHFEPETMRTRIELVKVRE